jgi:hypothetical protein
MGAKYLVKIADGHPSSPLGLQVSLAVIPLVTRAGFGGSSHS